MDRRNWGELESRRVSQGIVSGSDLPFKVKDRNDSVNSLEILSNHQEGGGGQIDWETKM